MSNIDIKSIQKIRAISRSFKRSRPIITSPKVNAETKPDVVAYDSVRN